MKKYIIFFFLVGGILATACDDLIERDPLSEPSDNTFWSNETELEMALTASYSNIARHINGTAIDALSEELTTDVAFDRTTDVYVQLKDGGITPETGLVADHWEHWYKAISTANQILTNMPRAKENVSESFYQMVEGEAKFLRALFYFNLTRRFGDVVLLDEFVPYKDLYDVTLTPQSQVVEFILKDLSEAVELLPESRPADERWRATKALAKGYEARIALYFGTLMDNSAYLTKAKEAAEYVINSNKYSMYYDKDDASQSYRTMFTYKGEGNPEFMLIRPFDDNFSTSQFYRSITTRNDGGFSNRMPSQDLVDSYEMTDGMPIDESPAYVPSNPFTGRDPRLAQTVLLPRVWDGETITTRGTIWRNVEFMTSISGYPLHDKERKQVTADGTVTTKDNQDAVNAFSSGRYTGYVWLKYLDELGSTKVNNYDLDIPLMRLAEMYLIAAEAIIETNGDLSKAAEYINVIRARAYGAKPNETEKYPEVTAADDLRKIVRRERKVELVMEGLRKMDLVRWGIDVKALAVQQYGRPLNYSQMGPTDIPVIDEDGLMDYSAFKDKLRLARDRAWVYEAKYRLWPIPQKEIDLNPKLNQNPNY